MPVGWTHARPSRGSAFAAIIGVAVAVLGGACSPEAVRTRDGGPGADPGNTPRVTVRMPRANPQPADTTLWPGKAMAPVDLLARGDTLPHS
jgi:hypothetical protein